MALMAGLDNSGKIQPVKVSTELQMLGVVDWFDYYVHEGRIFHVQYSVADIGVLTTPDDMITLSFTTPAASSGHVHLTFGGFCESGARLRLIEGKTGGGATPTGTVQTYNKTRSSTITSGITDVAGANAGKVSYDATLFTGGTTLLDIYMGVDGIGQSSNGGESHHVWELAAATVYQLSMFDTGNVPAQLYMEWIEFVGSDGTDDQGTSLISGS
jgi:hypothetical protein